MYKFSSQEAVEIVNLLYQSILERQADQGGLEHYASRLVNSDCYIVRFPKKCL